MTSTLWCPHWCPRIAPRIESNMGNHKPRTTMDLRQPLLCLPQIHCPRSCRLWDAPTHSAEPVHRARGEGEGMQLKLYSGKAQLHHGTPFAFKGHFWDLSASLLKYSVCLFAQEDCCKNEKNIYTYIHAIKFIDFDIVSHVIQYHIQLDLHLINISFL